MLPDAPLSNHTIRVDIQWTPSSLPGWILFYDLECDQQDYYSPSSTTGTNTFSHSSLGYENYPIQFRFGSLDPNQPTITGTYQLYYDGQLIRSENFQAQPATYSSYAYFNTYYSSPVLTDYTFSIPSSEICAGSYESIYITTGKNCQALAEINTELDSIKLTITNGKEFVSFYENGIAKDTVTFMFNEINNIYLKQDSNYAGQTPLEVTVISEWAGIIKNDQVTINPQEQFQIRVPDQPITVFSGGIGGLKIEAYSQDICPPIVSAGLKYTAIITKGKKLGNLVDNETGIIGDTLTNLNQQDGIKYIDFITEGNILSVQDTAIVKVFTNDENIDTTEAVIIIYPNDLVVQIIPSVIQQGDTARVVLKKRGVNGLEDFAADKLFNVEIVQGLEYGLILDSLSNDTLTIFSNIPQGFKIIAKDSTGIDSTRIRIKVSTEESGFPVAKILTENKYQINRDKNGKESEGKGDSKSIIPNFIIPGPILLEGFGDVVVKLNPFIVEIDPPTISAGDTARIIPKYMDENGNYVEYPANQTFELGILDGCVLGKLSNAGIDTNYFYGVTQPFYFVADSSADSGSVNIRVGVIEMNQQNRSLKKNNRNNQLNSPVSCANVNFLENLYANGEVVMGSVCKTLPKCTENNAGKKPNFEIYDFPNGTDGIDVCNNVAGSTLMLWSTKEKKMFLPITIENCYNDYANVIQFGIKGDVITLRAIITACEDVIKNRGYTVLYDTTELRTKVPQRLDVLKKLYKELDELLNYDPVEFNSPYYPLELAWEHEFQHKRNYIYDIFNMVNKDFDYLDYSKLDVSCSKYRNKNDVLDEMKYNFEKRFNDFETKSYNRVFEIWGLKDGTPKEHDLWLKNETGTHKAIAKKVIDKYKAQLMVLIADLSK